jgi:uncharacterized protein
MRNVMSVFPQLLVTLFIAMFASKSFSDVYFSEYIEGSSNNKALEIYNSGDAALDLSAYKIEMYFNGAATVGTTINLNGTIASHGVFVVAHASANAQIMAKANLVNSSSWFNGDDAIVLKQGTAVVDSIGQVGFDPGAEWGTGLASTMDNTLRRATAFSGDKNPNDEFIANAQWVGFATDTVDDLGQYSGSVSSSSSSSSSSGVSSSSSGSLCGQASTAISAIQGAGQVSPRVGTTVTVEAVVTATFQGSGQMGGFFIQETGPGDGNSLSSEGIYIKSTIAVAVGSRVRVTGVVAETFELTQIVADTINICALNQPLPAITEANLPVQSLNEFEAIEGMRVHFANTLTVNENYQLGRFGEILLSHGRLYQPTHFATPGAAAAAIAAGNALNMLVLDDGRSVQNPDPVVFPAPGLTFDNTLRSGDTLGQLTGILFYDFGQYRLAPTVAPTFIHSNERPSAPIATADANLKIAGFNLLNFFNGNGLGGGFPTARGADTAIEFDRQKAKLVNAIRGLNADVLALMELENDGFGETSAIAELVRTLNSFESSPVWRLVNPGLTKIGTDEISVGIIYRSDRALEVGNPAILSSAFSPLFIDTKNRPSLAQSFRATSGTGVITVVANHFKSKGSDCNDVADPDLLDGQGNCAQTRKKAAIALTNWINTRPTGVQDGDYLIVGDLNSYAKEDAITALKTAGFSDLIADFIGPDAYSYVFDGQAGYLDHALASASLLPQVKQVLEWHINADEPTVLDYNTEFKTANQIASFYSAQPYRVSDHDPLVVMVKLVVDLDGDGDVDSRDVQILQSARNTVVTGFDQRDLNANGRIDIVDARLLSLQCTRTNCAIQ